MESLIWLKNRELLCITRSWRSSGRLLKRTSWSRFQEGNSIIVRHVCLQFPYFQRRIQSHFWIRSAHQIHQLDSTNHCERWNHWKRRENTFMKIINNSIELREKWWKKCRKKAFFRNMRSHFPIKFLILIKRRVHCWWWPCSSSRYFIFFLSSG